MEDVAGFGEINDEQAQAVLRQLKICGEHLQAARGKEAQLKRALGDYEELRQTLQSLPERVEHRVMVPFGKMAFFPGSLRHTNEITVLLGDNYFALRSAAIRPLKFASRGGRTTKIRASEIYIEAAAIPNCGHNSELRTKVTTQHEFLDWKFHAEQ